MDQVDRCHELGLGRGINVTDPHMWKNKSSFCVRQISPDLRNIVWTEESGLKERYDKEVSTIATQQLKIKFSLDDPSTQVKIGMDAHNSQSTTSAKMISGIKIKTRTLCFKVDFSDLPAPDQQDSECESEDEDTDSGRELDCFEDRLSLWILKRIRSRTKKRLVKQLSVDKESDIPPIQRLKTYMKKKENQSEDKKEIANDCEVFVRKMGITHYVSSIELGALSYNVTSVSERHSKMGAGAQAGAASVAEGGISSSLEKHFRQKVKAAHEIGRIGAKGEVERNTPDEAVIGFQIQPIYKLVKTQQIQVALQRAIKDYIQRKADKTEGPFLISCEIGKKPVYWTVNDHQQLIGTESVTEAAPFYIIPTGDTYHPSDFFIAYWGRNESDRERSTRVTDPAVPFQAALPRYLSTDSNILGQSKDPLTFKTTVEIKQARFSLHSRVQSSFACMMCLSTPLSVSDWIDGEQFYINCSHHSFKLSGYVAMTQEVVRNKEPVEYTYNTSTKPIMEDPYTSKDTGMIFRLLRTTNSDLSDDEDLEETETEPLSSYYDPCVSGGPSWPGARPKRQETIKESQTDQESPPQSEASGTNLQAEKRDDPSPVPKPRRNKIRRQSTTPSRRRNRDHDPDSFAGKFDEYFGY